jgi:hypothetical protein
LDFRFFHMTKTSGGTAPAIIVIKNRTIATMTRTAMSVNILQGIGSTKLI